MLHSFIKHVDTFAFFCLESLLYSKGGFQGIALPRLTMPTSLHLDKAPENYDAICILGLFFGRHFEFSEGGHMV